MESVISAQFVEALSLALRSVCQINTTFQKKLQFTGDLFMTLDQGEPYYFLVNEVLSKCDNDDTVVFKSESCQKKMIKEEPKIKPENKDADDECFIAFGIPEEDKKDKDKAAKSSQDDLPQAVKPLKKRTRTNILDEDILSSIQDNDPTEEDFDIDDQLDGKSKLKKMNVKKKADKIRGKYSMVKTFKCAICQKGFSQKHYLLKHEATHTGEKKFSCHMCEKGFTLKKYLDQHLKMHTKPFLCSFCGKGFSMKSYRHKHELIHKTKHQTSWTCDVCGKGFAQKRYLDQHKIVHSAEKQFTCKICGKQYKNYCGLRYHEKNHRDDSGVFEKSFVCTICDKKYSSQIGLQYHMDRKHSGKVESYICQLCGKTYSSYAGLKYHEKHHPKEGEEKPPKIFSCKVCDKEFSKKSHLKQHQETHKTPQKNEIERAMQYHHDLNFSPLHYSQPSHTQLSSHSQQSSQSSYSQHPEVPIPTSIPALQQPYFPPFYKLQAGPELGHDESNPEKIPTMATHSKIKPEDRDSQHSTHSSYSQPQDMHLPGLQQSYFPSFYKQAAREPKFFHVSRESNHDESSSSKVPSTPTQHSPHPHPAYFGSPYPPL